MTKKLDEHTARAARDDARALEAQVDATEPYPAGTQVRRPNRPSRMFNVRLTEEQFEECRGWLASATCRCRPWHPRGCWSV